MVHSQLLHLHSLGDFALIILKKEITYAGPIGKEKGAMKEKNKKYEKLHRIIHNIAEAHPHSKI
jgi:hypothetical protein